MNASLIKPSFVPIVPLAVSPIYSTWVLRNKTLINIWFMHVKIFLAEKSFKIQNVVHFSFIHIHLHVLQRKHKEPVTDGYRRSLPGT